MAEFQGLGLEPVVLTYSAAISVRGNWSLPERVSELLTGMQGPGPETDLLAFSACVKGQEPGRTSEQLAEMQGLGPEPDVFIPSLASSACEKGHQHGRAPDLLTNKQWREQKPRVHTQNGVSACVKGQHLYRALELLVVIQGLGLESDVITYNAAISARVN